MLRYILVVILFGIVSSAAYRTNHPRRQQFMIPASGYGDSDYDFLYPAYAKDSNSANERPTILSYWNNIFRNARLPRFNITNPFSKLFTPYVIKVDFPPENDEIDDSTPKPTYTEPQQQKQDKVYLNVEPESPQFFYDPVTQQYYEMQQIASQDYNPENNYYATTFKDDDEIIIDLGDSHREQVKNQDDEYASKEQDDQEYTTKDKETGIVVMYNTPAIKRFSARRSANDNHRKLLKGPKKSSLHGA